MTGGGKMRLDQFLRYSRLVKRRPLAKRLADGGAVHIEGKAAKASCRVEVGGRAEPAACEQDLAEFACWARRSAIRRKKDAPEMFEVLEESVRLADEVGESCRGADGFPEARLNPHLPRTGKDWLGFAGEWDGAVRLWPCPHQSANVIAGKSPPLKPSREAAKEEARMPGFPLPVARTSCPWGHEVFFLSPASTRRRPPARRHPAMKQLDAEQLRRTLRRLSHEIVERTADISALVLIGIRTRGYPPRGEAGRGDSLPGGRPPAFGRTGRHAVSGRPEPGRRRADQAPENGPFRSRARTRTSFSWTMCSTPAGRCAPALAALVGFGRPRRVRLAILVDRGGRELPVRADFVGKNIEALRNEGVRVRLEETDGQDAVFKHSRESGR